MHEREHVDATKLSQREAEEGFKNAMIGAVRILLRESLKPEALRDGEPAAISIGVAGVSNDEKTRFQVQVVIEPDPTEWLDPDQISVIKNQSLT